MELVQLSESEVERFALKRGDLLFARQSLVLEGTGKCSLVMDVPEITCFESHLIRVRLDKNKADPNYFYYYFGSQQGKANVQSLVMQVSAAGIRGSELASLQVPIPPLPTQRKIAAILSAYDDLIENNLRRIKILEEMAQNLYREWFVKFRFPGYQQARFIDSPLGRIPEGWEVKHLLSIADVTYGFAFQSKEFNSDGNGKPVIRIRDVLAGTSDTFSPEEAGKKYLVENGDILIGMDGDFHMGFWVGGQACLVQRVARFRPKAGTGRYHLFLALQEPIQHLNATITGTTVAHLGDTHIKKIQISWAHAQLRNQLNDLLDPMLDQILRLRIKTTILCRTRDLLLPRLISGEVDVSELDIKETVLSQ
jgi:type I restriction enzyme S subunit